MFLDGNVCERPRDELPDDSAEGIVAGPVSADNTPSQAMAQRHFHRREKFSFRCNQRHFSNRQRILTTDGVSYRNANMTPEGGKERET
ncbi:hypothetical protein RRF57_004311 [Xylaria bambusicola]|uniref:Uncharacterized protein n=1 Tax=Xylaria bambusicola TaxID=326684 RepID=A0AAN7Z8L9_9PEZI